LIIEEGKDRDQGQPNAASGAGAAGGDIMSLLTQPRERRETRRSCQKERRKKRASREAPERVRSEHEKTDN
jgi:hypothetical protein